MISKAFFRSSLIFTAGGALPMLASLLLLPFYTNFLSGIDYTRLLFYISVSAISQVLFSLATDTYFGIRYSQLFDDPQRQRLFISTTSRLLVVSGLALLVVLSLAGPGIFRLVFSGEVGMSYWPYGFLSVLTGFFNAYYKTASICLIYLKRPGRFLFENTLNFVLTVSISVAGLYLFPSSLAGPIAGRVISGAVIFMLGARTFRVNGAGAYSREFIPELVQFCLPYLVYGICIWLLSGVDRYILQANVSFEGLNSYDLVLKCFIGIDFLQNSLSAVIFPRIYEIWAKHGGMETTTESNRYFNVFTVINIFQLIIFCLLLPLLYQLVIRKEYFYDGQRFLSIIAAGYALRSVVSFFLAGVLFSKSTRLMLLIFGISALVQICASALAIPAYGLDGALYAMLFTRVVQAVLFAVLAPGVFRFTFNRFKIFVIPAVFVVLNAGYYAWTRDHSPLFFAAQLVLFTVIAGIAFRKELVTVAHSLAGEKGS